MVMPFGKHKGWPLRDLPVDYFAWLASLGHLRDPLRSAVNAELERRRGLGPDPRIAEALIAAGQRALARRHHPDVGGTNEGMLAVRTAADWLLTKVAVELRGLAA